MNLPKDGSPVPIGGRSHKGHWLSKRTLTDTKELEEHCQNDFGYAFECQGTYKTQWFDRDDPSGKGDFEYLANLRKEYPDQICSNPTACEVETTSGVLALKTGDSIPECTISLGFACVNTEIRTCQDYKIRFTCPESVYLFDPSFGQSAGIF
ncbi:hypothetical protein scyTo_0004051 [Scyliorhinus torazame]|uniref:WxxW domain-containing protein n=1 Tax=Scyliorhinus torazame TaxID=75743 RepID=A0A401NJU5_SCYTO|nr:hypothetical protein [Scyliorhinus torazame]